MFVTMENLIDTFSLDTQNTNFEIEDLGKDVYRIKSGKTAEIIEVLAIDIHTKTMTIRHNHSTHVLVFKNELDLVLDKMGIKRAVENISSDIKAPMPGKVIEIVVKEGDVVSKGDPILILEAMKMENVLKAENDCTIKKVLIASAESVEKNQILVELEPVS